MINLSSLEAKASQVRFAVASMALLVAVAEESDRIPPVPASVAAEFGLELHQKFGGGKNIALAKGIASGKAIAHEQIQAIAMFFETFEPDREDPGWQNNENPSRGWICWLLMGTDWRWATNYMKVYL